MQLASRKIKYLGTSKESESICNKNCKRIEEDIEKLKDNFVPGQAEPMFSKCPCYQKQCINTVAIKVLPTFFTELKKKCKIYMEPEEPQNSKNNSG